MANFCENCGSPLKEGYKFCENCGAPIKPDVEPETGSGSFAAGAAATTAAAAGMTADRHNAPVQQASDAPITGREAPFITKSAPPHTAARKTT
ncbi:MAG: zinc ribbon domain-containing protein [Acidaminococcaceae bacterium]|nr:zinc ribbon domain-containing protein [Acidaminococcaceae bacterium]